MADASPGETLARDAAQSSFWDERRKLATLCRITASLGYLAEFGHISLRVAGTNIVLVTPGAGALKSTVTAEQIFVYDTAGNNLFQPRGLNVPIEFLIHTRIHSDRPEMLCVAHLTPSIHDFSASSTARSSRSSARRCSSMRACRPGTTHRSW